MAVVTGNSATEETADEEELLERFESSGRDTGPMGVKLIVALTLTWALFQLWIASPFPFLINFGVIVDVPARSAHLAFALLLCFMVFPATKRITKPGIPIRDFFLGLAASSCALYPLFAQEGITKRVGVLLKVDLWGMQVPIEAIIGGLGILFLLEATRRAIGLPLVIICTIFLVFSIFGQSMPDIISHKGVSLERLIGYQWLTGEAIFGIPIDVSVSFVFLFVSLVSSCPDDSSRRRYTYTHIPIHMYVYVSAYCISAYVYYVLLECDKVIKSYLTTISVDLGFLWYFELLKFKSQRCFCKV